MEFSKIIVYKESKKDYIILLDLKNSKIIYSVRFFISYFSYFMLFFWLGSTNDGVALRCELLENRKFTLHCTSASCRSSQPGRQAGGCLALVFSQ